MAKKTLEERIAELEGLDVKTRVRALEEATKRQARRKAKKLSGVIFPFPLCGCALPDRNGVVYRVMVPCDGTLMRALLDIEGVASLEQPAEIQAELKHGDDVYIRDFSIRSPMAMFDLEMPVMQGAKLKVRVTSGNVEGYVWTSLLFIPEMSSATIKKIIMEDQNAKEIGEETS